MEVLPETLANKHGQRAIARCQALARISEIDSGILRQYLTEKHQECNNQVAEWMQQASMQTWQDEVGNQWGRLASKNPQAKRLIIGSHLDTVPNAGAYDGILGVMLGIELASLIKNNHIRLPFHLDIVGFCDEEGTRFGTTLIGSQALAGNFDPAWLDIPDQNEITMAEALNTFGLSARTVQDAELNPEEIQAYWEVHIEQGPILEDANQALGVVTAIAGAKRAVITFSGRSGHAGTTPMHLRTDALAAAAELTIEIEKIALACSENEVATVGRIEAKPGVANVIAGRCEMSLDVRAQSERNLILLVSDIENVAKTIAHQRNLRLDWQWTHQAPPVNCDPEIRNLFQSACKINQQDSPFLPSGAGHDAMAIAPICPFGMLFIRSPGGISHHPSENVIAEDVNKAVAVLYSALTNYCT